MKIFTCKHCGQVVYFENTQCERCGHALGFSSLKQELLTLETTRQGNWAEVGRSNFQYRYCANAQFKACNWILPIDDAQTFCIACQLNKTIPNLNEPEHIELWKKLEIAKHRLVYALLKLQLPLQPKSAEPQTGLAFDFLSDEASQKKVVMGHEDGLITINLNEADEAKRVKLMERLKEPYRTIIGHFRHEVGHYYWDRLIQPSDKNLNSFRKYFGDERADYGQALQNYYSNGPAASWQSNHISAYATSHPWEDWAETWAHYLLVMDTIEIAAAYGLEIHPREVNKKEKLNAEYSNDPYKTKDFEKLIDLFFPLTMVSNSLNRSVGQPDFYPFVMPRPVVDKMLFIHAVCRQN